MSDQVSIRPSVQPSIDGSNFYFPFGPFDSNTAIIDARQSPYNVSSLTADNGPGISAAINAAILKGGGTVLLPVGLLMASAITTNVSATARVLLRGVSRDSTTLKQTVNANVNFITPSCTMRFDELTIDGNAANQTIRKACIYALCDTISLFVTNCRITASANYGIQLDKLNKIVAILDNEFSNLSEWPNVGPLSDVSIAIGMIATFVSSGQLIIRGNTFINPAPVNLSPGGVQVTPDVAGELSVDISHNYFENFGSNRGGAQPTGCIDIYEYAKRCVVVGNRCYKSGCTPIKTSNAPVMVIANNVVDGSQAGISVGAAIFWSGAARNPLTSYRDVVIANNIVRNWSIYFAIHVEGKAALDASIGRYVIVSDNIIEGCKNGILLDSCADVVADGNMIEGCTGTGVDPFDAGININQPLGNIYISGGHIKGGARYGIYNALNPTAGVVIVVRGVVFDTNTTFHIRAIDTTPNTLDTLRILGCTFLGATPTGFIGRITNVDIVGCRAAQGPFGSLQNIAVMNSASNSWDFTSLGNVAGAVSPDTSQIKKLGLRLTGNVTIDPTLFAPTVIPAVGTTVDFDIRQDGAGGRTVTWNNTRFAGGVAPVMTVGINKTDHYRLIRNEFAGTWDLEVVGQNY